MAINKHMCNQFKSQGSIHGRKALKDINNTEEALSLRGIPPSDDGVNKNSSVGSLLEFKVGVIIRIRTYNNQVLMW